MRLIATVPLMVGLGLEMGACSNSESPESGGAGSPSTEGDGGTGSSNKIGTGGAGGDLGLGGDQGAGGIAACVATGAEATLKKKPVDIIFIIDNSGSMGDNIESVQDNINDNFAAIIGASGIDYRVIMISEHGELSAESICVGAPLSTTDCAPVPDKPGQSPPVFYQYSIPIGSHNSLCQMLSSYDGTLADQFDLGSGGWKKWLRAEAFKVFVEVTDDGVECALNGVTYDDNDNAPSGEQTAKKFDETLLALDPEQFGDAGKRNYVWHSIVGLYENTPATTAYGATDPLVDKTCTTAVAEGTAYQVLSQLTGGLRFPICQFASFDVVFQDIAKGVIEGAAVACDFPVPPAPDGETIDLSTVVIEYTPGDGGEVQKMKQVPSAAECQAASFYIEDSTIKLCPDACAVVQGDTKAKVNILFGCEQIAE